MVYSVKKCPLRISDCKADWDMAQSPQKVSLKSFIYVHKISTIKVKLHLSVSCCYVLKPMKFEFRQKVSSPKKQHFGVTI